MQLTVPEHIRRDHGSRGEGGFHRGRRSAAIHLRQRSPDSHCPPDMLHDRGKPRRRGTRRSLQAQYPLP
jgi:hypothetical protein